MNKSNSIFKNSSTMDHGINLKYNDKLSDIVFLFLFFPKPFARPALTKRFKNFI